MKTSIIYNKVAFVSFLLLLGCTKVELLDESEVSKEGAFSLKYEWKPDFYNPGWESSYNANWDKYKDPDWKKDPADPEYPKFAEYQKYKKYLNYQAIAETPIYLAMTRILNTRHHVYLTDVNGKFWEEKVTEETPEAPSEDPQKPPFDKTTIPVSGGEYIMVAFSKPLATNQTTGERSKVEVLNLNEFQEDKTVGISKIVMRHVDAKASEIVTGRSWEDLNPGYRYVFEPGDEKLYVSRCDYLQLSTNKPFTQRFVFEPLMQHVEVCFAIEFIKDEAGEMIEVAANDIFAELSGMVQQVNLSNGLLNTSETRKMIVTVDEDGRTETEDGLLISYRASYHTFGLIGGVDKQTISGPGVFRLGIYLNHNGRTKTVRVVSNLSEKITQQGLTEMTGKVNERKKLKNEATLTIDTRVVIKVSAMDNNSNDGISGWTTEGKVDAEA